MRFLISGSESPAAFVDKNPLASKLEEGERYRQMAKMLIGNGQTVMGGLGQVSEDDFKQLSNEISAPYEVPQYPIEQIETKLIRYENTESLHVLHVDPMSCSRDRGHAFRKWP